MYIDNTFIFDLYYAICSYSKTNEEYLKYSVVECDILDINKIEDKYDTTVLNLRTRIRKGIIKNKIEYAYWPSEAMKYRLIISKKICYKLNEKFQTAKEAFQFLLCFLRCYLTPYSMVQSLETILIKRKITSKDIEKIVEEMVAIAASVNAKGMRRNGEIKITTAYLRSQLRGENPLDDEQVNTAIFNICNIMGVSQDELIQRANTEPVKLYKEEFDNGESVRFSELKRQIELEKENIRKLSVITSAKQLSNGSKNKIQNDMLTKFWESIYPSRPIKANGLVFRPYLSAVFEEWKKSNSKTLLIHGNLGMGKTSFILQQWFAGMIHEECIYFCRRLYPKTADPNCLLQALVYSVAMNSAEYAATLELEEDYKKLFSGDSVEEIAANVISSFYHIKDIERLDFVIDALDEAFQNDKNMIVRLLQNYLSEMPSWLHFVMTTRSIPDVMDRIKNLSDKAVEISDNGKQDTRDYFQQRIGKRNVEQHELDHIIDMLVKKAEGSFLYAKLVCDEIIEQKRSIHDLQPPDGLSAVFSQYLDWHLSGKEDFKNNLKPFLNIVCVYKEIVTIELLADILQVEEEYIQEQFERIPSLFQIGYDGSINPIHISVLEYFESGLNSDYKINRKKGNRVLATFCLNDSNNTYSQRYMIMHFIAAGIYNEAEKWMNSKEFAHTRLKCLGVGEANQRYIEDLKLLALSAGGDVYARKVMEGLLFVEFVSYNRDYLYHNGLLYDLKDCGIDMVIDKNVNYWLSPMYHTSELRSMLLAFLVVYFYRLRSFSEAKKLILSVADIDSINDISIRIEIFNWLGVCYMKELNYSKSIDTFSEIDVVINNNRANLSDYSVRAKTAFSEVNIGKVITQWQLSNWENDSYIHFNNSINLLKQNACDITEREQKKESDLILAEYYTTSTSFLIWTQQSSKWCQKEDISKEWLQIAHTIYEKYCIKDQWYIRYCFIHALYELFNGSIDTAFDEINEAKSLYPRPYEMAHILYVEAIAYYFQNNMEKCESLLIEARNAALMYRGYLEFEEINSLWELLGKESFSNPYEDQYDKPVMWIEYITDVVEKNKIKHSR